MGLRAIIVDDEYHARENLRLLIEEYCPSLEIVGEGSDIESGVQAISELDPQIVFLDIRMPSGSEGFELLNQIKDPSFLVVFVTAFKDYAIDAFKVNAVDYILKPIDIDELIQTVKRLENRFTSFRQHDKEASDYRNRLEKLTEEMVSSSRKISISHATGIKVVRVDDIVALKAESNCTKITFKDGGQYLDTRTLKFYESELEPLGFYRIHRSYMINMKELDELSRSEGNEVIMSNGTKFPVARSAMQGLMERIKSL